MARWCTNAAESENLCMRGHSKRENREIPSASLPVAARRVGNGLKSPFTQKAITGCASCALGLGSEPAKPRPWTDSNGQIAKGYFALDFVVVVFAESSKDEIPDRGTITRW